MIPIFSPQKSAYRVDSLVLVDEYALGQSGGIYWRPDGTRLFYGRSPAFTLYADIYYADASTAYDPGTLADQGLWAQFTRDSANNTNPAFTAIMEYLDGGTKLVGGHKESGGNHKLFQYESLSPDYGTGQVAISDEWEDTGGTLSDMRAATFSQAGAKLNYIGAQAVYSASLSTAYDISTLGSFSLVRDLSSTLGSVDAWSHFFGRTESQYFVSDENNLIWEFRLSTPGDISTASATGTTIDLSGTIDGAAERASQWQWLDGGRKLSASTNGNVYVWDAVA